MPSEKIHFILEMSVIRPQALVYRYLLNMLAYLFLLSETGGLTNCILSSVRQIGVNTWIAYSLVLYINIWSTNSWFLSWEDPISALPLEWHSTCYPCPIIASGCLHPSLVHRRAIRVRYVWQPCWWGSSSYFLGSLLILQSYSNHTLLLRVLIPRSSARILSSKPVTCYRLLRVYTCRSLSAYVSSISVISSLKAHLISQVTHLSTISVICSLTSCRSQNGLTYFVLNNWTPFVWWNGSRHKSAWCRCMRSVHIWCWPLQSIRTNLTWSRGIRPFIITLRGSPLIVSGFAYFLLICIHITLSQAWPCDPHWVCPNPGWYIVLLGLGASVLDSHQPLIFFIVRFFNFFDFSFTIEIDCIFPIWSLNSWVFGAL